jgi:hypothetical protein
LVVLGSLQISIGEGAKLEHVEEVEDEKEGLEGSSDSLSETSVGDSI